jgi:MoaA/NifB/PqqE/SkfB family radical SAM enzyme
MAAKISKHYLPEIFAFLFGRARPGMVTINLTSRCNQRCIYCEIGVKNPSTVKDKLTVDDLKWIIDEMALNNIPRLALCGGEPFLFDGIMDVVEYAGKNSIVCAITTNGMNAYELEKDALKVLRDARAEINISMDSFDDKVQSCTRGIDRSVELPLKSIEALQQHDIPLILLTVISRYNYEHLFENLIIAHDNGIRQVLFQPVIYHSNYADRPAIENKAALNVPPEKIHVLLEELRKIHRFEQTHGIKTNVYRILPWISQYLESATSQNGHMFFQDILKKFYCRDIDAIVDIAYDGGIQPCGLALAESGIHENRHLGLLGLWSAATAPLREQVSRGDFPDFCNACCHHFSRNMLASVMKYPIQNRIMLFRMVSLFLGRAISGTYKKIKFTI